MALINHKLVELLGALDRSLGAIKLLAKATQQGIGRRTFRPYHAYRSGIDEYYALVTLIEGRLGSVHKDLRDALKKRLAAKDQEVLTLIVRSATEFFFALSAIPVLPIGIREVFEQELKALQSVRERLQQPEHVETLWPQLEMDLEMAEEILMEVMKKAPSLVDFDEM